MIFHIMGISPVFAHMLFSCKCGIHKPCEIYTELQSGLTASSYCCKHTHTHYSEGNILNIHSSAAKIMAFSVLNWGSEMFSMTFSLCIWCWMGAQRRVSTDSYKLSLFDRYRQIGHNNIPVVLTPLNPTTLLFSFLPVGIIPTWNTCYTIVAPDFPIIGTVQEKRTNYYYFIHVLKI